MWHTKLPQYRDAPKRAFVCVCTITVYYVYVCLNFKLCLFFTFARKRENSHVAEPRLLGRRCGASDCMTIGLLKLVCSSREYWTMACATVEINIPPLNGERWEQWP